MKRPLALLISAGVTTFILIAVLAVAASRLNFSPAIAATVAPNVIVMTATPPPTLAAQSGEWEKSNEEGYGAEESDDDKEQRREVEFKGVVEAMTEDTLTVSGQVLLITEQSKIKRGIGIGSPVKVHALRLEDGGLWAKEIELDD